jgi:hypothetical protein
MSVSQLVITMTVFVFMALSRGTFSTLSPVVAAQQQERKRRESLSSRTKVALDSLIENNRSRSFQKKTTAVVPNLMDEQKLFLFLNKSKEATPKKPNNPRRHSDSPYHTMKNTDIPPSAVEKPTISHTSATSHGERKTPNKSRQLSRNASNESINTNLQSDILYKKLDDLVVEQRRQESQNPLTKRSRHSSLENLKFKDDDKSSSNT